MNIFLSILRSFLFLLTFYEIKFISCQIYDNYTSGILEEGNYYILDVTDYHNKNLIVSSSKSIYIGIPPSKKVETNVNLINSSAIITINDNYLLAACLKDSFLGKINLSNGNFISLLLYSDINITPDLDIPITTCSLSNMDNTIFIGYSRIDYFENEINKTNIVFKLNIINKESIEEGPSLDESVEIKYFIFPQSTMKTSSQRQISCEPIKIKDDPTQYRLICLHGDIDNYEFEEEIYSEISVYITSLNSEFDDFKFKMKEYLLQYMEEDFGFRIFRENNTFARCLTGGYLGEIYLTIVDSHIKIKENNFLPNVLQYFETEADLFYYNNKFRFSVKKTSFMGKKNIYSFQINQNYYSNYFILYNYQEKIISKILGYYNEDMNKIIFIYQTDNAIKYFMIDNKIDIYTIPSDNKLIKLKSYEEYKYDLNDFIQSPSLNNLGNLNVESIKYKLSSGGNLIEYYGNHFYKTLITNNIIFPEPSLSDWKTYYLSFIENLENYYTKIYHIESLTVKVQTCENGCYSCWDGYESCTNCTENANYASLYDKEEECFPPDYFVDEYVYDPISNKFLKCFNSCELCSNTSESITDQKCQSCLKGYLYSYKYPGNCYSYPDLEITDEKELDNLTFNFTLANCSKYKIASTGECIEECPLTSPYYSLEYNETSNLYEKINHKPPQYLFNKICYEQCPENSSPNENKECVCDNLYYINNEGNIFCVKDECPSKYPYLKINTKECFNSLEKKNVIIFLEVFAIIIVVLIIKFY